MRFSKTGRRGVALTALATATRQVPQIYVTYPPDAGEPPIQLKAFEVVRLQPDEAWQSEIKIPLDDLAIFDEPSRSRLVPPGRYEIHLGLSSIEQLLKAALEIEPMLSRIARRRAEEE